MRILYSLAGEGLGHATRSTVVITHLLARGHQVRVLASGRAFGVMRRRFADVVQIEGLGLAHQDGALDVAGTMLENARRLPRLLGRNAAALAEADVFAPGLVVTDFEPFACSYGQARGLPVLSVDNNQMIARCMHAVDTLGAGVTPTAARVLASLLTPGCDHYVVTTFFYPPLREGCRATTTLVPPIVRAAVVQAARVPRERTAADHVLVYQTVPGDPHLAAALAAHPAVRFVVYGAGKTGQDGNRTYKAHDEHGFLADLAAARAVVANGGMSLLGEALYLGKPVYSVPLRYRPEQAMNAAYLGALGYGATSERFDADVLGDFLARAPGYSANVRAAIHPDGNRMLYEVLDRLLAERGVA